MVKHLVVDADLIGQRADVVVTRLYPSLSRAFVHKLFNDSLVLLNQQAVKPGYKLRLNDKLDITFDESKFNQIPDIELPIIFEDKDIMVIDKPAGIISHSRSRYWDEPSVASFVRQRIRPKSSHGDDQQGAPEAQTETYPKYGDGALERATQLSAQSGGRIAGSASKQADAMRVFGGDRAGIVHRLDRATSGVMICAKNTEALAWLQKQFAQHKVKKTYRAIVSGHMRPSQAIIDMPIERNPKKPTTFKVSTNGKSASTVYRVMQSMGNYDEVELLPTTGRTHQLRVHLKHQGHPIVGDVLYDGEANERLLLHAYSLEITLPNRDRQIFTAPLPKEFKKFIDNA